MRAELSRLGLKVSSRDEFARCDVGIRFAAVSLVEETVDGAMPEDLIDSLGTFEDLAHFANLRRTQEGNSACWSA